jgi:hypothetical protein
MSQARNNRDAAFLPVIFFDREDEADMFPRNVG